MNLVLPPSNLPPPKRNLISNEPPPAAQRAKAPAPAAEGSAAQRAARRRRSAESPRRGRLGILRRGVDEVRRGKDGGSNGSGDWRVVSCRFRIPLTIQTIQFLLAMALRPNWRWPPRVVPQMILGLNLVTQSGPTLLLDLLVWCPGSCLAFGAVLVV